MGWEAYFETLFQKIDGKMLNEHKAKYQGMSHQQSIMNFVTRRY